MTVVALFASHTPLIGHHSPGAGVAREVDQCFETLKTWVDDYAPELIIEFGPDHFNGFFYHLMPSFCVGVQASSIGDWQTPTGVLPVPAADAEALVSHLHAQGIDSAVSYRMAIDHGFTQLLAALFPWDSMPPLLPIFINCAAPPRPPLARVIALGAAVGRYAAATKRRVLIMASGGLSHDPPIPALANAPAEVRERLIAGGELSPEARAARQRRVIDEGRKSELGTSSCLPLNPDWDQRFLDLIAAREFDRIRQLGDEEITAQGGRGGHEIRTWVAAAAAINAVGSYASTLRFYRAIPAWMAGFAVMTATVN